MQERTAPTPTTGRRLLSAKQFNVLTILGAGALIAFVFWRDANKEPDAPGGPPSPIGQRVALVRPPDPVTQPPVAEPVPIPAAPTLLPRMEPASAAAPQRNPRMVSYPVPAQATAAAPPAGAAAHGAAGQEEAATTVAFAGRRIAGAKAGAAMDTTLVLMPGVYRCTLDTAVSSERPGPFFCHVTAAWQSPSGVPLMDPGTRIQGNYESHVAPGQSRIMSLAATAYTPQGVPVPLGSPVGDALGRVGMDGAVDRHFWTRFGGAVFLMLSQSAISAASSLAQAALSSGNGNTFLNLNTGGVQGAVGAALRDNLNVPNTVTKNQGEEIGILVTQPIDFSDAYRLRLR